MGEKKKILKILIGVFLTSIIVCIGWSYNQSSKTAKKNITIDKNISDVIENTSNEISKESEKTPGKIAYITIDDGPSKYTSQILDILDSNNVKGTFFMLNNNMILHKEEINRMIKEGHGVGFHGVSHDIKELYKTETSSLEEFETCNETLYEISGKTSKLIRLPYGSKPYTPQENYDSLIKNDYLIWDWTLDTQDWKSSTDQIVSNVLYYGREREEIVILMHEKEQTVKALNDTIKILKERGYTILPITENISPKNFWLGNTNS
ncbi:MAG: polysaccharide deacetylase family protein [Peptostreptococcaceae bacterium]|nr:polysaccharide deacetylase family protein [Peptostreptococcaceae bacterium]